jgi:hypothetical protein
MKQKKLFLYSLLLVTLVSCAANKQSYERVYSPRVQENALSSDGSDLETQKRILIYNADMEISVTVPDSANVRIVAIANSYGGYVQSLNNKTTIIRIKSEHLNNAIADISKTGTVKSKIISGNDVTEQYYDLQIRLDNAYNARKRYTELFAKAETVESTLKIEKELERLNGEIDLLEGKIKRIDHLAEFSTITVHISEKVKPGLLGYIGIGLYETIKWLFVRN